jgi:hypothetical protein
MRGLIIDFVRDRRALKRGGDFHITQLPTQVPEMDKDDAELSRLSEALDELAVRDAKLVELVDLKYFCGYTFDEIAAQRGTSIRTVKREWEKARAWLFHQLKGVPHFGTLPIDRLAKSADRGHIEVTLAPRFANVEARLLISPQSVGPCAITCSRTDAYASATWSIIPSRARRRASVARR